MCAPVGNQFESARGAPELNRGAGDPFTCKHYMKYCSGTAQMPIGNDIVEQAPLMVDRSSVDKSHGFHANNGQVTSSKSC